MDTSQLEYDPKRMELARRLSEAVILVVLGAGLLGVTAWFTGHAVFFYITAGIATLISLVYIFGMIIMGVTKSGSGYIPICILLMVIGILVTHKFLAGLLLGGAFFGIYTMAPLTFQNLRRSITSRKLDKSADKLEQFREDVYSKLEQDKNQEERIAFMSDTYDKLRKLVSELAEKTEELDALIPEVEKLQEYQESGKWQQDFEADERGEISLEVNRSVLSEDGLYDLLSDLDVLYNTFDDIMAKAGVYDDEEEVEEE